MYRLAIVALVASCMQARFCSLAPATQPAAPVAPIGAVAPVAAPRAPTSPPDDPDLGPAVWLGVNFAPRTPRIQEVLDNAPGQRAGLRTGDEVVALDGTSVGGAADVRRMIALHKPGDRVTLTIRRDGKQLDVPVVLAERPVFSKIARDKLMDKPAPGFSLPATTGDTITLANLTGHVVVLDFWATWCGPCELAIPDLRRLAAAHPNARVIGISDEDLDKLRAYAAAHQVTYLLAHDNQRATADYLVEALPTTVIVDKHGVVREIDFGFGNFERLDAIVSQLETN